MKIFLIDFLTALIQLLIYIVSIPLGLVSLAAAIILVVVVLAIGIPTAIAVGLLAAPLYLLYELREYLNEL